MGLPRLKLPPTSIQRGLPENVCGLDAAASAGRRAAVMSAVHTGTFLNKGKSCVVGGGSWRRSGGGGEV